eukprot:TRINITY_DN121657_c0_g1_i1.p1 TRINITY_DN121657_c0_g1~~TRINITY_DN121657_c0_g1_i1.p1  ORF type:complete len:365 (-),score=102.72 TRINITY_DN121657_c0_g1_i1:284-1378(-)
MKLARGTVLYAFYAHLAFGASNFLIGYMNAAVVEQWVLVGVLWCTGAIGLVPAAYFLWKKGSLFFQVEEPADAASKADAADKEVVDAEKGAVDAESGAGDAEAVVDAKKVVVPASPVKPKQVEVPPLKLWVKLITIATGIVHALGEYFMKEAFAAAPSEIGPLSAFVSSEALVVAVFSHFVYNEYMNFRQSLCVTSIAIGLTIIGVGLARSPDLMEEGLSQKMIAFSFATGGMLCFAGVVLGMRMSLRNGVAPWSGVVVRFVVEFIMGTIAIVASFISEGLPEIEVNFMVWMYPIMAGLLQAVGMVFVNKALKFPNTGVANAIYSSNSIVVLILGVLVDHLYPSSLSLIGMGFVVAAVAGISLT